MLSAITAWLIANKTVIFSSVIVPFLVFTVAKLPDPRLFEGRWYYPPYYGFFTVATYYSTGEWNQWGGKLTLPFKQTPKLENVEHPKFVSFTAPKFIPYDQHQE